LTNIQPEHRIETCVMSPVPKSVLIVSNDEMLRTTRAAVLKTGGYSVATAASDNEAMALLETRTFDLVLIGRKTDSPTIEIDERLRERFPKLLVLKIEDLEEAARGFADRETDSSPEHVLLALKQMLGE
jgi:CheY-like chemotaxis protein